MAMTRDQYIAGIKDKLTKEAPARKPWPNASEFFCPVTIAMASNKSIAEITKILDEIYVEMFPQNLGVEVIQRFVAADFRYALSRFPDADGKPQVLPQIHKSYIIGFGADKMKERLGIITPNKKIIPKEGEENNPLAASGKALLEMIKTRRNGIEIEIEADPETSQVPEEADSETEKAQPGKRVSVGNHAQQIIYMVKHLAKELEAVLPKEIIPALIERDLLCRTTQGAYYVPEKSRALFEGLIDIYEPYNVTFTMLRLNGKFKPESQTVEFDFEVRNQGRVIATRKEGVEPRSARTTRVTDIDGGPAAVGC